MDELKRFVNSRDAAFTAFVMNDDWDAVLKHFKKYGQSVPEGKEIIAKAGVLKAVQECIKIPDNVKAMAAEKCIRMGFRPTMF